METRIEPKNSAPTLNKQVKTTLDNNVRSPTQSNQITRTVPLRLILASSSPYRQDLLARLRIPFSSLSPDIDETPLPNETPTAVALRLAVAKAQIIVSKQPGALVIGADQVATFDGRPLGKPGNFRRAQEQLGQLSGQTVEFHSAVCVTDGRRHEVANVTTLCRFRHLDPDEIDAYLNIEQPFDTTGSAKAESLGIALMESMQSNDPTAIIGLPLITLSRMLRSFALNPITHKA